MTESFASTYFHHLAEKMEEKNPVFQHEDLFICDSSPVYEVQLYRELSEQFANTFQDASFCFYKIRKYSNNVDFYVNRFILYCQKGEANENFWYSFFPNHRIIPTDSAAFTKKEVEPILSLFINAVNSLPENRLLIETNAIPLFTNS